MVNPIVQLESNEGSLIKLNPIPPQNSEILANLNKDPYNPMKLISPLKLIREKVT
jgi:hypothetical protein